MQLFDLFMSVEWFILGNEGQVVVVVEDDVGVIYGDLRGYEEEL